MRTFTSPAEKGTRQDSSKSGRLLTGVPGTGHRLVFGADVQAQSGAYATGVLVLILSAALAAMLALWCEQQRALAVCEGIIFLVFAYALADNCVGRPGGLIIGSVFTLLLMLASGLSRSIRSVELRIPYGYFADVESWCMGPELRGKKVHLVPVKDSSAEGCSGLRPRYRGHRSCKRRGGEPR